jgi:methylmalonyl-CoA decarboxylase
MVVATPGATFAITPAKLGVPYNAAGVSHFLGVLPLHVVKEMFFTAQPISAQRAEQYGLVNRIADPAHTLAEVTTDLAAQVARTAPLVVQAIKAEIAALTDASPITPEVFERLTALRRAAWSSADYAEGLASFHERRPAHFTGK